MKPADTSSATLWRDFLRVASERVGPQEARWLVERATGREGADHLLSLDEPVSARAAPFFLDMLERRVAGEPLQYVLGRWQFRTLELFVDRRVLIPRPETEVVAGHAIDAAGGRDVAVDLGTGSGAIALSLAAEVPGLEVWAADSSGDALDVARANLAGVGTLAASRVRLVAGDWYGALPDVLRGRVDVIVSNPPYIADGEELPDDVVDWEPAAALFAGPTGLEAIEHIVAGAGDWLSPQGTLVVELAPHQAGAVVQLVRDAGAMNAVVHPDLAGRDRCLVARW